MKLLRSTLTFSGITFLSRLAGYVRDSLQTSLFGVNAGMDAFLIAYRIPNFLRRIFAEGSFQQAFVPVFTEAKAKGDERAMHELLDHVAGALLASVMVVTAICMLAAPGIAAIFAPGSLDEPEKFGLIARMLRITFPYLTFISLTALAAGVLNSYGRFAIPALTPVLHNLAVIAAALWLAPHFAQPVVALAWGVFAAGAVQLIVQWLALSRLKMLPRPRVNFAYPGVRRVLTLMLPTIFSSSVAQVNLLVGTAFASMLATGSQTWLYLTDRLLEFPQGMFGVALGTVILPHLSRKHADTDTAGFSAALDWGLRMALLVAVPAALGLCALAEPICATLYKYGQFTDFDTRMAALSLTGLSLGLPGFMLAKVLAPAFYSRQDTKTPMRAAVVTVIVNVVLMVAIVTPLWWWHVVGGHAGIAISTALAGSVNASLLFVQVRRQGLYRASPGWARFGLRVAFAGTAMVAALILVRHQLPAWTELAIRWRWIHLAWVVPLGAAVYGAALLVSGLRMKHLREG